MCTGIMCFRTGLSSRYLQILVSNDETRVDCFIYDWRFEDNTAASGYTVCYMDSYLVSESQSASQLVS